MSLCLALCLADPDYPLARYDKVLIDPRNGIPVDFEQDNKLFIIPIEDVVGVFRKELPPPGGEAF